MLRILIIELKLMNLSFQQLSLIPFVRGIKLSPPLIKFNITRTCFAAYSLISKSIEKILFVYTSIDIYRLTRKYSEKKRGNQTDFKENN